MPARRRRLPHGSPRKNADRHRRRAHRDRHPAGRAAEGLAGGALRRRARRRQRGRRAPARPRPGGRRRRADCPRLGRTATGRPPDPAHLRRSGRGLRRRTRIRRRHGRVRRRYGRAVAKAPAVEVEVGERTVRISNPDRVYFPATGATKLDLVDYYLAVGAGIVNALRERPCMLHRFPTGVSGEKVHQKRVPAGAPPWLETVRLHFPRYGRTPTSCASPSSADVIWAVQMSTVEFHPWNSRRADTEQPDEWRIDLDPMPDCPLGHGASRRPRGARGARRARRGRLAEDLGRQGAARLRADRADARVHRTCVGRRWPSPARSSAARPTT